MAHKSDQEMIAKTRNTARFFTETPHVSWVLLVFTMPWRAYAYLTMPKRRIRRSPSGWPRRSSRGPAPPRRTWNSG